MKQKDLMLLLVPSFIMVAAWVIFNIRHNFVSSTISENLNMQITPITPTFDIQEIDAIQKRNSVNPSYEFQPASSPATQAQTTSSSSASQTLELSTQTSTSGGNLSQ